MIYSRIDRNCVGAHEHLLPVPLAGYRSVTWFQTVIEH
jgi:hypothetical protein